MTSPIIITLCVLLLLAYIFDLSSSRTRIPSAILLLILGFLVRQITLFFQIAIPDLTIVLPVLGTIGLILIVLEGSLELELNRSKLPFVGKTALMALLPMVLFSFGLAFMFQFFAGVPLKVGLVNAIPFTVISSAVAIPSVQHMATFKKEFITYESSLSDIFGVIFFYFIALNESITFSTFGFFTIDLVLMLIITFVATIGLAYILSHLKHNVKYVPIILIIVLIYAISKIYHFQGLIFILLFGLFLGNLNEFRENKYIQKLNPDILENEVHKFKDLTTEFTFLIRSLFFLLFGYLIEANELLNTETIIWAVGICAGLILLRFIFLKLFSFQLNPLVFIAPRGLITILLFLSIPVTQSIWIVTKSLVIQVIAISAFIMMLGLLVNKKIKPEVVNEEIPIELADNTVSEV